MIIGPDQQRSQRVSRLGDAVPCGQRGREGASSFRQLVQPGQRPGQEPGGQRGGGEDRAPGRDLLLLDVLSQRQLLYWGVVNYNIGF